MEWEGWRPKACVTQLGKGNPGPGMAPDVPAILREKGTAKPALRDSSGMLGRGFQASLSRRNWV